MYALIETNLDLLNVSDGETEVVSREALDFLSRNVKQEAEPFDLIFFDPPYAMDYEEVLDYIGENAAGLLAQGGVIVVEHHKKKDLPKGFNEWQRYRVVRQGDSCLSLYQRAFA
jgi:16S rRNA G966 N2-methylase RsmD